VEARLRPLGHPYVLPRGEVRRVIAEVRKERRPARQWPPERLMLAAIVVLLAILVAYFLLPVLFPPPDDIPTF
jgi:hypothetical protein